jgi:hypothetical protein
MCYKRGNPGPCTPPPPPSGCGACSGSLGTTFSYSFTYRPVNTDPVVITYGPGFSITYPPTCALETAVTISGTITLDEPFGDCIRGHVVLPLKLLTVLLSSPVCYDTGSEMVLTVTCCSTSSRLSANITSPGTIPLGHVVVLVVDTDFVSFSCGPYTSTWQATANDETCTLVISE